MLLGTHTQEISQLVEEEKALEENAGKHILAIRSGVARRLWNEQTDAVKGEVTKSIEEEFNAAQVAEEHLQSAPADDPVVQAKYVRDIAENAWVLTMYAALDANWLRW